MIFVFLQRNLLSSFVHRFWRDLPSCVNLWKLEPMEMFWSEWYRDPFRNLIGDSNRCWCSQTRSSKSTKSSAPVHDFDSKSTAATSFGANAQQTTVEVFYSPIMFVLSFWQMPVNCHMLAFRWDRDGTKTIHRSLFVAPKISFGRVKFKSKMKRKEQKIVWSWKETVAFGRPQSERFW